jgi:hypothetical protein
MNTKCDVSTLSALRGNGRGGPQKSCCVFALDRRRSNAQIFFLRRQLLRSFKRNQINQTLGSKGVARSQVDEIADLFSRGGGGSKAWRTERGDRRRTFVRKIAKLNTKSPPGGRVKTMDPFVPDRRATDTNYFAQLAKLFLGRSPACQALKIVAKFRVGGGRRTPTAVTQ